MNKTLTFILLAVAACMAAVGACDKTDGISVVPQFSTITSDPATPMAGDTLTLTAHQSVKGKLTYSATYNWAFRYFDDSLQRDTTVRRQEQVVYDYVGGPDPQMGLRLPAYVSATRLYVTLTASYGLSGQTEQGQIFGQASASATVTLQPKTFVPQQ